MVSLDTQTKGLYIGKKVLGNKRGGILVVNNGSDERSNLGRYKAAETPNSRICLKEISGIEFEFT